MFKVVMTPGPPKTVRDLVVVASEVRHRKMRNPRLLLLPPLKSAAGQRAFSCHASKWWNSVVNSELIGQCKSIVVFKEKVREILSNILQEAINLF